MDAIFSWVISALGALFVVAVAVAWWEHLVRQGRPPAPPSPAAPRVVTVDVALDELAAAPAPVAPASGGDAALRRATLDEAMSRMARAQGAESGWTETEPMVLQPPSAAVVTAAPGPAPEAVPERASHRS